MKLLCVKCNVELETERPELASDFAILHFGHDVKLQNTNIRNFCEGDKVKSVINPHVVWEVLTPRSYNGKVVLRVVSPVRPYGITNEDYTEKELLGFMYKAEQTRS